VIVALDSYVSDFLDQKVMDQKLMDQIWRPDPIGYSVSP
jgi:hypothetical protein